ncbi:MAG: sugar-binding protein, partial [Sedimentisphaerales bacterium]|nr:sugar-binding protein [Sedimentisphaerales bacterium]
MLRKLFFLTSFVLLLGLVGPVAAQDMEIALAAQPPVLDGEIDDVWADASEQYFVPLDDPANGSGIWKVLYDAENLYVLVDVTDDSLQNDSASSWQDDSVEIYFDGGNTKLDTPLSGDDHQYTFGWTTDEIQGTNADGYTDGIEHAQVDTDTGWRIEVKMPWMTIWGVMPQASDMIGIDCYYNDDDDGGDSRENKMLSFSVVEGWNDASQWASAILAGETAAETLSGLADVTVVDGAIESLRLGDTEYVVADGDLMLGTTTRWYVLDGVETLWVEGDPAPEATVSGSSTTKEGDVGSKADNFLFTLDGATNISSIDGIDFQETIFPSLSDTFILFERGGNDAGSWQAIYADGSLGEAVQFDKASNGGPYADTGVSANGQNGYGVVFKTSVPVQGVRITASGHDTLSISAVPGPSIAWVSYHAADDEPHADAAAVGFTQAPDIEYTDLLKAQGYDVVRVLTSQEPDVEFLNTMDLVIISRTASSGHYSGAGASAWNSVTAPMINLNGYTLRNSRMGFTTGGTMVDTIGDITLAVTDPAHPIFAGISITDGIMDNLYAEGAVPLPTDGVTISRGISVNNDPIEDEGTVLATVATVDDPTVGGMVIAEWPAGAIMENSSGSPEDVLGGPRLVFLTGSREPDGVTGGQAAALYDLYEDGTQMFLNAVDYMLNLPEPVVPGVNLLTNGGFEDGVMDPWNTYGSLVTTAEVVQVLDGAAV